MQSKIYDAKKKLLKLEDEFKNNKSKFEETIKIALTKTKKENKKVMQPIKSSDSSTFNRESSSPRLRK